MNDSVKIAHKYVTKYINCPKYLEFSMFVLKPYESDQILFHYPVPKIWTQVIINLKFFVKETKNISFYFCQKGEFALILVIFEVYKNQSGLLGFFKKRMSQNKYNR